MVKMDLLAKDQKLSLSDKKSVCCLNGGELGDTKGKKG